MLNKENKGNSFQLNPTYPGGPFNILSRRDSGGYVLGQTIHLDFEINNNDPFHGIIKFHVDLIRVNIQFLMNNAMKVSMHELIDVNFSINFRKLFI